MPDAATTPTLIIFDLDGTLVDSKLDITHATNATRAHMGLEPLSKEQVGALVGHGAPVLVKNALGPAFNEQQVAEALEFLLTYYDEHLLDNTCLYPGVSAGIDHLRSAGMILAVLTNKPIRSSLRILDGLKISDCFVRVYGGNSLSAKKPNPVGINALRSETGASARNTLMVGDSSVDVQTARNAGVRVCGVTWGFQPESFLTDPPDISVDSMSLLVDYALREVAVPASF